MVNDQNGDFVVKLCGKIKGLPFGPSEICFSAMVMVKMGSFVVKFRCEILG